MRKLLFLFICAIATISFSSTSFAITGGTPVAANDLLSRQMALLKINRKNGVNLCSGFYYSPTIIVTAAHCLTIAPKNTRTTNSVAVHDRNVAVARATDVNIFHRHANAWRQPKEIRLNKTDDVAVLVMQSPHPGGYRVGIFDERRASEIVDQLQNATFINVGHDKIGLKSTGEMHQFKGRPWFLALVPPENRQVRMARYEKAGPCRGDSGAPIYVEEHDGTIKLVGMLRATQGAFLSLSKDDSCSQVSIFTPMSSVKQIVEKLMAE